MGYILGAGLIVSILGVMAVWVTLLTWLTPSTIDVVLGATGLMAVLFIAALIAMKLTFDA